MDIPNVGIDCKGKTYKRIEIGKVKDISQEQFTYLKPLFRVEAKRNSWLCLCKCKNLLVVQANHLIAGDNKSCGCYQKEQKFNSAISHIGEKFGELIIQNKVLLPGKNGTYYQCLCSCGKTTYVEYNNLVSGNTKSCGHLKTQIEDLTGKEFGFWKVLSMIPRTEHHIKYLCECKCGERREVRADWLKNGRSQSCGCKISSQGADKIEFLLKEHKISYKKEVCFPDLISPKQAPLRFDFAIFENNKLLYIIEYDGELHYQERKDFGGKEGLEYRKLCDKIKNDYCLNNSIPLHRIPYYDKNSFTFEDILSNKYLIS